MDQPSSHALIYQGERLTVGSGDVTVGRSRTTDLTISDPSISRRHAVLRAGEGHIVVRDLGSSNGTFINDRKVISEDVVEDGDLLRFGDAETQVSIAGAAASEPVSTVLPHQPGEATFFLQAESLNLGAGFAEDEDGEDQEASEEASPPAASPPPTPPSPPAAAPPASAATPPAPPSPPPAATQPLSDDQALATQRVTVQPEAPPPAAPAVGGTVGGTTQRLSLEQLRALQEQESSDSPPASSEPPTQVPASGEPPVPPPAGGTTQRLSPDQLATLQDEPADSGGTTQRLSQEQLQALQSRPAAGGTTQRLSLEQLEALQQSQQAQEAGPTPERAGGATIAMSPGQLERQGEPSPGATVALRPDQLQPTRPEEPREPHVPAVRQHSPQATKPIPSPAALPTSAPGDSAASPAAEGPAEQPAAQPEPPSQEPAQPPSQPADIRHALAQPATPGGPTTLQVPNAPDIDVASEQSIISMPPPPPAAPELEGDMPEVPDIDVASEQSVFNIPAVNLTPEAQGEMPDVPDIDIASEMSIISMPAPQLPPDMAAYVPQQPAPQQPAPQQPAPQEHEAEPFSLDLDEDDEVSENYVAPPPDLQASAEPAAQQPSPGASELSFGDLDSTSENIVRPGAPSSQAQPSQVQPSSQVEPPEDGVPPFDAAPDFGLPADSQPSFEAGGLDEPVFDAPPTFDAPPSFDELPSFDEPNFDEPNFDVDEPGFDASPGFDEPASETPAFDEPPVPQPTEPTDAPQPAFGGSFDLADDLEIESTLAVSAGSEEAPAPSGPPAPDQAPAPSGPAFDAPMPASFDAPTPDDAPAFNAPAFDAPAPAFDDSEEPPVSAWSPPETFTPDPIEGPEAADERASSADLLPGLDDITSSVGPLEMRPPEPIGGLTSGAMPAVEEEDAELAGFGLRLLANLLDVVLFGGLTLAAYIVTQGDRLISIGVACAGVLVIFACWMIAGTSPGKRSLGLLIVDSEGENRLGFLCALKRAVGVVVSLGLGFLMVAFTQDKRGLHDKIAGTWVYRT